MPSIAGEISQVQRLPEAATRVAPVSLRRERAFAAALFLSSLAYLCLFLRHCSLEPDEGIVLQGAERILRGQVPYRDFFTFYTPGSFYLVAFIFRTLGDSLVAARFSLALAGAISSLIAFLLARRVCSFGTAMFVGVLTTVAGCAYRFLVLHNWFSTLFCCASLFEAVCFTESRRNSCAFATGLLASLALLTEQSKGAGLFLGLALAWLILRLVTRSSVLNGKNSAAFFSGVAVPSLTTFAYFAAEHSLTHMLQSWLWPLRHYTQANHVPYGWQNWSQDAVTEIFRTGPIWLRAIKILAVSPGLFVPVLPLIAVAILVYQSLRMRSRAVITENAAYYVIICSVCSGLLVSIVVARADVIHFMYLTPLWFVVLAWILERLTPSRAWNALRPFFMIYVPLGFGLLALALLLNATGARVHVQTRRGSVTLSKDDAVLTYLQSHTRPRQPLLVYPYLPLYNYLTATQSPSRYDDFQIGMNTPEQAHEIITSLQAHPGTAVLLEPWFAEKIASSWPETPLGAIAIDPVSDYIAKNYRVCKMLTSSDDVRFEYMVAENQVCP